MLVNVVIVVMAEITVKSWVGPELYHLLADRIGPVI